jgi:type II secretory pathway predicted ATPase ExeA
MYTTYFGLSELPFSIAPNPDYLFMSERHREALAHLSYGLGETGGFVLLTGEVGTGKTTISRCLMAQLPENTQTAFILNPTLSSQELLATLCDELKIRYRKTGATLKTLTDKIQEKLLKNHQNNINTLLIIDEAQHLQAEVLEQLRLLTNLETNTKKLLQVVLIGQPELQLLLQRRDLRQLAQRITARYHLLPLSKEDVNQYIQHRLTVADCYRNLFDKKAVLMIHKLSQGIPRLINLLCDRSLWIAYGDNKSVVDKKTVIKASQEALGEQYIPTYWWQNKTIKLVLVIVLFVGVLAIGNWWGQSQHAVNMTEQLVENKNQSNADTKQDNIEQNNINRHNEHPNNIAKNEQSKAPETNLNTKALVKGSLENNKFNKTKKITTSEVTNTSLNVLATTPKVLGYIPEQQQKAAQSIIAAEHQKKLTVQAREGVSPNLLHSFEQAIKETDNETIRDQNINTKSLVNKTQSEVFDEKSINSLGDLSYEFQQALPSLQFEMHIYASDGQGWVRVNGKDVHEGEKIAEDLFLEKIFPQKIILNFRGKRFSMRALSSW